MVDVSIIACWLPDGTKPNLPLLKHIIWINNCLGSPRPPPPPPPPSPSPLNSLWPGVSPVARVFFYLGRLVSSGKRKIDLWTLTQHSPLLPYLFLNKSREKIFSPMIQQISYTIYHRMLPLFVERTVSWYFWPPFLVKKALPGPHMNR